MKAKNRTKRVILNGNKLTVGCDNLQQFYQQHLGDSNQVVLLHNSRMIKRDKMVLCAISDGDTIDVFTAITGG